MSERSADKMVELLLQEPARLAEIKADPTKTKEVLVKAADDAKGKLPKEAYILIVTALGGVAIVAAIGAIILVGMGKTDLNVLVALGSAAVGALAGTLMPQKG